MRPTCYKIRSPSSSREKFHNVAGLIGSLLQVVCEARRVHVRLAAHPNQHKAHMAVLGHRHLWHVAEDEAVYGVLLVGLLQTAALHGQMRTSVSKAVPRPCTMLGVNNPAGMLQYVRLQNQTSL